MSYSRVSLIDESSSQDHNPFKKKTPSLMNEALMQTEMAWPVVVNMVCYRAPWVISIAFVGRLGEVELASAAMASTLANVSGLSIVMGLSNAQSTLSSQAFGGGDYERVGIVLQRSIIVFGTACFLVSLFWAFGIESFLVRGNIYVWCVCVCVCVCLCVFQSVQYIVQFYTWLCYITALFYLYMLLLYVPYCFVFCIQKYTGQDSVIAENSAKYLILLIPGLFGNALCVALQRFLQVY
jgi:hypothetical protein